MLEQLKEQIKAVAIARKVSDEYRRFKLEALAKWEEDNKQTLDFVVASAHVVEGAEAKLRELTLQAYAETGDKAPAEGVGIRERTVLTYDGKVAFDWAKSHKMALQLDKRAFEKIAKADPPDFVKITTEPQATIATNLDDKTKG